MPLPHQFTLALRHLTPGRVLDGVAALPLPFLPGGRPDLAAVSSLMHGVFAAGLTPAINTFTGVVELLSPDERQDVLAVAAGMARGRRFLAGALPDATDGSLGARYRRAIDAIVRQGGTALMLQTDELVANDDERIVEIYRQATSGHRGVVAVETGRAFPTPGRVYSLDLFHRLLDLPSLAGMLHASLDRVQEWYRVEARDVRRPDFRVYSGNELAVDMVSYGSDYLLGVAGCVPQAFALRDRFWRAGDPRGFTVNDLIQYLGCLLYRTPLSAARHSAVQFLQARGILAAGLTHPGAERRPGTDVPMLHDVAARLDALLASHREPQPARVAAAGSR
jgi:dihydrodipicolinate synthase/N-acetylneuraminate lyase